jgi:uncharacterized protein involved in type VI secretion and phage assembly
MTLTLFESIQEIVRDELGRLRTTELATVQKQHPHASSGDTDNYACTVALRDSGIVLGHVPVATGQIGAACIPAVGDLVVVEFVNGDINHPIIVGRLYNDQDRPPENDAGQAILELPLAGGGIHLELDGNSPPKVILKVGSSIQLKIQDDDPAVVIDVGGSGTIKIAKNGDVSLKTNGDLKLEAGGNIDIEAQSQLTLKGSTVNIN